ncbi:MAG TPA: response regulator [Actinomycetota bacterium]|nr:response regulator [Actinomycetota bacterium]
MTPRFDRPVELLLIEDNPGDVRLIRGALAEARSPNNLHIVADGEKATAFLKRRGEFADAARPELVILDLNLPRKDGREVLAEIRADPELGRIPVVVLTTSDDEQDIVRAYELHASCYLTKPVDLEQFLETIRLIDEFWLTTVKLPRR